MRLRNIISDIFVNFSNWKPGQPDNAKSNEDCAVIGSGGIDKWNDYPCYPNKYAFICESDNPDCFTTEAPTTTNTTTTTTAAPTTTRSPYGGSNSMGNGKLF